MNAITSRPCDSAEAAARRGQHLAMLARLAELGIELSELAARKARAEAATAEAEAEIAARLAAEGAVDRPARAAAGVVAGEVLGEALGAARVGGKRALPRAASPGDPHLAFARTARAVCLIIALEARLLAGDVVWNRAEAMRERQERREAQDREAFRVFKAGLAAKAAQASEAAQAAQASQTSEDSQASQAAAEEGEADVDGNDGDMAAATGSQAPAAAPVAAPVAAPRAASAIEKRVAARFGMGAAAGRMGMVKWPPPPPVGLEWVTRNRGKDPP